jgi:site-specific recombinase XerD
LNADVVVDNTGIALELPVIITGEGLLSSYLQYMMIYRNKSRSWQSKSVQAIQLLLDYISVNQNVFQKPQHLFSEFSNSLFTGTVDQNGDDPSGLRWKARDPKNAKNLINLVTHYTDWLANKNEDDNLRLNPYRKADSFEEKMNWAAYYQKRDRAFNSHLWAEKDARDENKSVRSGKPSELSSERVLDTNPPKSFPEQYLDSLLWTGFTKYGHAHASQLNDRCNLRDILITILMNFGGLRLSETFHLYIEDIEPDEEYGCTVRVHHPETGLSPCGQMQRSEYLKRKYGLAPRNRVKHTSTQYSGWKGALLTDSHTKSFEVYWFPSEAGFLFRKLWGIYLADERCIANTKLYHPYAFTGRNGQPATIKSFNAAHKRAVERIGLTSCKEKGTTPHGHRHAYGHRLSDSGVKQLIIKNALHHSSLESSGVYTEPGASQVRKHLRSSECKMSVSTPSFPS